MFITLYYCKGVYQVWVHFASHRIFRMCLHYTCHRIYECVCVCIIFVITFTNMSVIYLQSHCQVCLHYTCHCTNTYITLIGGHKFKLDYNEGKIQQDIHVTTTFSYSLLSAACHSIFSCPQLVAWLLCRHMKSGHLIAS